MQRFEQVVSRLDGYSRDNRIVLPVLYLVPVLLGFALIRELSDNPFFRFQLSDDAFYLKTADQWARGRGIGPMPLFFSPLYPAFLALLAKLSLSSPTVIRLVQVLIGSLSYPMVHVLTRRLFGRRAAFIAYALVLGYGLLLQGMTEMVSAWLEVVLTLGVALLLSASPSTIHIAAAGLLTGILCLGRPNFVLLVPVFTAALAFRRHPAGSHFAARGLRGAAIFTACFAVPVLPVTIRNLVVGHDIVFISAHGGVNFYIGNSPGAGGTFRAPPGFHEDIESLNVSDSKRLAEQSAGRTLSASEVSRFWFRRGLRFLLENPGEAALLYARKILLLFHAYEVPSNSSYSVLKEGSLILKLLPVSFPFLAVAGVVGVGLSRAHWRKFVFLYALLSLLALSVTIFFVSSRFRLPMACLLAVFAGHAFDIGTGALLARKRKAILLWATSCVLFILLSYPYPVIEELRRDHSASSYEIMGIFYFGNNLNANEAEALLRRAITINPARKEAHWYLARILEQRGDILNAEREWDRASFLYWPGSEWGQRAAANRDRLRALRQKLQLDPLPARDYPRGEGQRAWPSPDKREP